MKSKKGKSSIYIVFTTVIILVVLLVIIYVYYDRNDKIDNNFGIDTNEITNIIKDKEEQISTD